jgi:hypothetical protein
VSKSRPKKFTREQSETSSTPSLSSENLELSASPISQQKKISVGGVNMVGTAFNPADQLAQMKNRNRSATTTAAITEPLSPGAELDNKLTREQSGTSSAPSYPNESAELPTSPKKISVGGVNMFGTGFIPADQLAKMKNRNRSATTTATITEPVSPGAELNNSVNCTAASEDAVHEVVSRPSQILTLKQQPGKSNPSSASKESSVISPVSNPSPLRKSSSDSNQKLASTSTNIEILPKTPESVESKPIVPSKSTRPRGLTIKKFSQDETNRVATVSGDSDQKDAMSTEQLPVRLSPSTSEEKLPNKLTTRLGSSSHDLLERKSNIEMENGSLVIIKKSSAHSRTLSVEELQNHPIIKLGHNKAGSSTKLAPNLKKSQSGQIIGETLNPPNPSSALPTSPSATFRPSATIRAQSIPHSPLVPTDAIISEGGSNRVDVLERMPDSKGTAATESTSLASPSSQE